MMMVAMLGWAGAMENDGLLSSLYCHGGSAGECQWFQSDGIGSVVDGSEVLGVRMALMAVMAWWSWW